jgi:arylsulfatase
LTAGKAHIVVALTPDKLKETPNAASFAVRKARQGEATLQINDKPEGSAHFANVSGTANETLDVGSDLGSPVSPEYKSPNRFTGKIETVTIQLK